MALSVSQRTYEKILGRLVSGALPPGARLVNRVLAKDLGVSVIPVREALNRLASEGLVEHIPGAGAFARKLAGRDIVKLYSFREQLEVYAVREAAQHIQPFQLERLRRICETAAALIERVAHSDDAVPAPEDVGEWLELDAAFHEALIEAADNPWLARAAGSARLLSHVVRTKPRDLVLEEARKTLHEHSEIIAALAERDGEGAAGIMVRHIRYSMDSLLGSLSP